MLFGLFSELKHKNCLISFWSYWKLTDNCKLSTVYFF